VVPYSIIKQNKATQGKSKMTIIITKPELFAAACRFAEKSEARPYLQAVAIEPAPNGGAFIVSTDGHRMFVGYDGEAQFLNGPAHNCLFKIDKQKLPAAAFKSQVLLLDGTSATFCGWYEKTADAVKPLAADFIMTAPSIGHTWTFPAWRGVLPDTSAPLVPADAWGFNAEYIADFGDIERRLTGSKKANFTARMTGGNPALVSLGRDDCFGVLMPVRMHSGDALHDDAKRLVDLCNGSKATAALAA
jgi:hypothetical protein